MQKTLSGGGGDLLARVFYLPPPDTTADEDAHGDRSAEAGKAPQGWVSWLIDAERFADAAEQAIRYAGPDSDTTAAERAWSARVDKAVQGMNGVDSDGLDAWMQVHADSHVPELLEARLVAAWETHQDTTTSETAAAATKADSSNDTDGLD